MKKKLTTIRTLTARLAMTLVLAMLTAATAWAELTVKPTTGGTVTVSGTQVTATPDEGYYVNSVTWYETDPDGGGEVTPVPLSEDGMGHYLAPQSNGFIVVTFHKYSDYDGVSVTFNMKSHGTAPAAQDLHLGDKVTRPDDPTAEGYVFLGWYKNNSCTNPYDFDTVLDNTLKYDKSNDRYTLTLYAKWAVGGSCGKSGSDVKWYVSKSAGSSKYDVLTIFGSGEMEVYKNKERPWYDYRDQIKTVVVEEGVTTIGEFAFCDFVNVTSDITIPASVSIGLRAFQSVSKSTAAGIHISAAEGSVLTSIDKAFDLANASIDLSRCTNLTAINNENVFRAVTKDVTLPSSVTSICQWAFSRYSEYAFLGDHAYVVVPEGKALSVTIDGVTEPVVIEPTDGKADIIGCLYADPSNREASRALTLAMTSLANIALTANTADGNCWTTFYSGEAGYDITTADAYAYAAKYTYDDTTSPATETLTLHRLGTTIAKGEAVIIVSATSPVSLTKGDDGTPSGNNDLHGVDVRTLKSTLGSGTFYVMGKQGDDFGFFQYTADYMPARKAYLLVGGSHEAQARSLTMVFGGDETGIKTTNYTSTSNSDAWFTLYGRRLQGKPTAKGIFIHNGRKEVLK